MRALLLLTAANMKSFLRDRAALFWTLAFPLIFVVLFGSIFSGGQGRRDIGWADLDGSPASTRLHATFASAPNVALTDGSESDLQSRMRSGGLSAIVVSERVGTIKPHPSIFRAAEQALGLDGSSRDRILHVGDDWAADVVGAHRAGWRTAYLRNRQQDTPLPTSEPGDDSVTDSTVLPDLVIDELSELDERLEPV